VGVRNVCLFVYEFILSDAAFDDAPGFGYGFNYLCRALYIGEEAVCAFIVVGGFRRYPQFGDSMYSVHSSFILGLHQEETVGDLWLFGVVSIVFRCQGFYFQFNVNHS
jgi:hypothetical protein